MWTKVRNFVGKFLVKGLHDELEDKWISKFLLYGSLGFLPRWIYMLEGYLKQISNLRSHSEERLGNNQ